MASRRLTPTWSRINMLLEIWVKSRKTVDCRLPPSWCHLSVTCLRSCALPKPPLDAPPPPLSPEAPSSGMYLPQFSLNLPKPAFPPRRLSHSRRFSRSSHISLDSLPDQPDVSGEEHQWPQLPCTHQQMAAYFHAIGDTLGPFSPCLSQSGANLKFSLCEISV